MKIHCSGELFRWNCTKFCNYKIKVWTDFQISKMWYINVGGSVIRWFLLKTSISLSLKRYQDAGNNDFSLGGPPLLAFIRDTLWTNSVSKWLTLTPKNHRFWMQRPVLKILFSKTFQQPYMCLDLSGLLSVNFHEKRYQRKYYCQCFFTRSSL